MPAPATVSLASASPPPGDSLPAGPKSDAEWQQYERNLEGLAESLGVSDPKPITVVRWVSPEELTTAIPACMREKGYGVSPDGTYAAIPDAQMSVFNADMYACYAAYPVIPRYTDRLTDENIGNVYDWMISTEIPCLEAEGYPIDDVPSRATFISDYWGATPFFPYAQLRLSVSEQAKVEAVCAQWPPASVVYGD